VYNAGVHVDRCLNEKGPGYEVSEVQGREPRGSGVLREMWDQAGKPGGRYHPIP